MAGRRAIDKLAPTAPERRALLLRLCAALSATLAPHGPLRAQTLFTGEPGAPRPVAILFPDLADPVRKVFTDIIGGIEEQLRQRVQAWPLAPAPDTAELGAALRRQGVRVVIALGRQGLKVAETLDPALGLVVSGISSLPDGDRHTGICLSPDPALLFARLRSLAPGVRRVIVVYNPQQNDWLLRLAREAARLHGIELAPLEALDLAAAARLYQGAFAAADNRRDALWLPTDATTVDETTILPLVLREAWDRALPVFSSSFLHVRKGALFALYPNNPELGRSLGNLAMALMTDEPPQRGLLPLRDVCAALNLRTASHLGIAAGPALQRGFQFLYPEP
ncbi:ABC transporter substrate binding protein [Massilia antarctica]|uniref:ABC transporter substrate binding protein n=1 Tax=Massilia antarctica TaxID=2765360 RepID=UPI0006BDEB0F|nr:ABC transporter substrate binding protein [Massilia sp. H27-R4]MCY0910248.1 ABC transporter substrate binding protein [Massilia sp. H27-R4]CUI09409.1 ABC transporter substrate-binding protein [Janthinobacterium sp. CG23_2]CUU33195.1 ABC transporter substrate-binding protein [Janthinobacterium sp. CG23_2]